eukprot:gene15222-17428_t
MATEAQTLKIGKKLAPFNPAGNEVVDIALELLQVKSGDVLYDLGCGDARLLARACQLNPLISGVGIEYDQEIYMRACELIRNHNLCEPQVRIMHDNVLNIDFSDATCIFVYLVPEGMKLLQPSLLEALRRGVRIVTYVFSIPELTPAEVRVYKGSTKIYFYNESCVSTTKTEDCQTDMTNA